METGVYYIVHESSGRTYVGSASRSFDGRWGNHVGLLNKGRHHNRHLQRAWNKYGSGAFRFKRIDRCLPEDCVAKEQEHIDKLVERGVPLYNVCLVAGSTYGREFTDETKAKLSANKKALYADPVRGQAARDAISKRHSGMKYSEESKARLKEVMKNRYADPVNGQAAREIAGSATRGKPCSEELREKISKALTGREFSDVHRQNLSNTWQESREKLAPLDFTCDWCGRCFQSIYVHSKYCSKECYGLAAYQRQKMRRARRGTKRCS